MKKYGLQLRIPPTQQKKQAASKPPLPPPAFSSHDDDDDVEKEISRQASKNKALQKVEEQHKKALEEDPSVFDYDGVYDEMKEKVARPRMQDRTERKSKYIHTLMEKAKEREKVHEIIYERKILKERGKEDHLFADKEKFVTSAYKKKLAEQEKWLEEERLCQIREEKEDVTKKSDMNDFYFSLNQNVAFGARVEDSRKPTRQEQADDITPENQSGHPETEAHVSSSKDKRELGDRPETSTHLQNNLEQSDMVSELAMSENTSAEDNTTVEQASVGQKEDEHYKRSEDAVAAARERFLARKRARVQQ